MRIAGSARVEAPRAEVFRAICDPGTLLAVIPGAEAIEQVADGEYRGRITLRLPGIVGSYRTSVRLVDAVPPEHAGLDGRVDGAMGSITGRAAFTLAEEAGATRLDYRGDGVIDGPLARLDSRFAERLAASLIDQGLRSLSQRLASQAPAAAGPVPARPNTEVPE